LLRRHRSPSTPAHSPQGSRHVQLLSHVVQPHALPGRRALHLMTSNHGRGKRSRPVARTGDAGRELAGSVRTLYGLELPQGLLPTHARVHAPASTRPQHLLLDVGLELGRDLRVEAAFTGEKLRNLGLQKRERRSHRSIFARAPFCRGHAVSIVMHDVRQRTLSPA